MVKANPVHLHDDHDVRLVGAWNLRGDGTPSIIERRDEDFIAAMLEELAGEQHAAIVATHRPKAATDGALRLFQPIHRTFNLALLEAHCDTFGNPRLDPRKIASSGQVIRRVRPQPDGSKRYEAWSTTSATTTRPRAARSTSARSGARSAGMCPRFPPEPAFASSCAPPTPRRLCRRRRRWRR